MTNSRPYRGGSELGIQPDLEANRARQSQAFLIRTPQFDKRDHDKTNSI